MQKFHNPHPSYPLPACREGKTGGRGGYGKMPGPSFALFVFLAFTGLLFPLLASSQCLQPGSVFQDGEEIQYNVSYNWGPVWVEAGLVTFSVKSEKYNGKEAWHLKSTGKTYSTYDLFFKVRDSYETWIEPNTFQTYDFRRYITEGSYTLVNTMTFDREHHRILSNTKRNKNAVVKDTIKLEDCMFDMLASVYYTRSLDLANLKPDVRVPVSVVIDDNVYPIYIRALAREVIENSDGQRYKCIKFSAKMVQGTIFKGDEDMLVWVTDDRNHIPILVEAKILVGSVKAYLKSAKGLKYPMEALVKK
jgi:hypothetical protein